MQKVESILKKRPYVKQMKLKYYLDRIENIMKEFPEIKENMLPEEYEWFLMDLRELVENAFNKK
jgi:hypothetical protein